MSDELTFLRWAYANQNRFVSGENQMLDRRALLAAYKEETGNSPPSDYTVA